MGGSGSVCSGLSWCEEGETLWWAWSKIVGGRSRFGEVDMMSDPLADAHQRLYANLAFLLFARHTSDEVLLKTACQSLYRLHVPDLEEETPENGVERTPEERDLVMTIVIEALRRGMSVAGACASVPINRETVYSWARTWPEFAMAFEAARRHAYDTGARIDKRGERARSVGVEYYGEVREPAVSVGRQGIR